MNTETWIWHGFRMGVPATWELLRFSKNPRTGGLAFADEEDFRMEISWQEATHPPQWKRLLSDYRAALRETGWECGPVAGHKAWQLFSADGRQKRGFRAFRFFPAARRLVEIVLNTPKSLPRNRPEGLLDSCAWESGPDTANRWRAFGMDITLPTVQPITACDVRPAQVRIEFGNGNHKIVCERRGMADLWLKEELDSWEKRQLDAGTRITRMQTGFSELGRSIEYQARQRIGGRFLTWFRRRHLAGKAVRCARCSRIVRWQAGFVERPEDKDLPLVHCTHNPGGPA